MTSLSSWFDGLASNVTKAAGDVVSLASGRTEPDSPIQTSAEPSEQTGETKSQPSEPAPKETAEGDGAGGDSATASVFPQSLSTDGLKNFGGLIYRFSEKATKTVVSAAQQVKQQVEEKTILGDFEAEQQRFIAERDATSSKAVPPWADFPDETALKRQILSLSLDSRNFLRDPPAGTQFQFDYTQSQPVAIATLQEDPNLMKMRFALVPKEISEEIFWRNYFYRVSLITQSMNLKNFNNTPPKTPDRTKGAGKPEAGKSEAAGIPKVGPDVGTPPSTPAQDEDFVSDSLQQEVNESELQQVREALGITASSPTNSSTSKGEDDWEKELVAELNDFEMVKTDKPDDEWEKEISDLLEGELNQPDSGSGK